eukprot:1092394-Prorocentrum_minimum.AAC.1
MSTASTTRRGCRGRRGPDRNIATRGCRVRRGPDRNIATRGYGGVGGAAATAGSGTALGRCAPSDGSRAVDRTVRGEARRRPPRADRPPTIAGCGIFAHPEIGTNVNKQEMVTAAPYVVVFS